MSKFRPETDLRVEAGTAVNPSYEVHQVRWTKKALGKIGEHVRMARKWLDDNPNWCPNFVHAAPKPLNEEHGAEAGGGRSTPEATPAEIPYVWADAKTSQAQRTAAWVWPEADPTTGVPPVPRRRDGDFGSGIAPPKHDPITITNADGTPYVFPPSSDDEEPVDKNMPKRLMNELMDEGSFIPVTYEDSRRLKRAAARTSYRAAIEKYRAELKTRAERRGAKPRQASSDAPKTE